jgi:hypothetical protein
MLDALILQSTLDEGAPRFNTGKPSLSGQRMHYYDRLTAECKHFVQPLFFQPTLLPHLTPDEVLVDEIYRSPKNQHGSFAITASQPAQKPIEDAFAVNQSAIEWTVKLVSRTSNILLVICTAGQPLLCLLQRFWRLPSLPEADFETACFQLMATAF